MKINIWTVIKHLAGICIKKYPYTTLYSSVLTISMGFLTGAAVLFRQWFFDSAEAAVHGGSIESAIAFGILMSAFMIFILLMQGVEEVVAQNLSLKLQSGLAENLNKKVAKLSAINFESSHFLDEINKAVKGIDDGRSLYFNFTSIALFAVPYFIFMSIYLINLAPLLVLCVLFSFMPSAIGQFIRYSQYVKLEGEIAPLRRKAVYYERCINDREFARETRLLGAFWFFRKLYETYIDLTAAKSWKAAKRTELIELGIRFMLLAGYIGTILLMYTYLMDGRISIGAFAAVFIAIDQMFGIMEMAVNYEVGDITTNIGTVKNYLSFLVKDERIGEDTEVTAKSICIKNVDFTYPNASKAALKNINLRIAEKETIAIVGENGAGKSTLAKLIAGIYIPSRGDVLIDGYNTKDLFPNSIFKNISAVFQRYQRYRLTLGENITISQPDLTPNFHEVSEVVSKAEIDPASRSFPDGADTMLSREFGGVDLSGGQWQRIAIARGLYRRHNLIILDEPTAAIDPLEETRIYKLFAELSLDKTAVIITHRLGSAKIADRIVVMNKGQIADIGTHDELMKREGVYRDMYAAQAQWYELAAE